MAQNRLHPLGDRIIVKPEDKIEKVGSLFIPDTVQEKRFQATIVAVGPGRMNDHTGEVVKPRVAVGDVVVFGKYSGSEVEVDGERFLIVREADLMATCAPDATTTLPAPEDD